MNPKWSQNEAKMEPKWSLRGARGSRKGVQGEPKGATGRQIRALHAPGLPKDAPETPRGFQDPPEAPEVPVEESDGDEEPEVSMCP